MATPTALDIRRLREIGWALWDPIGLSQMGDDLWKDDGPVADEYDRYLVSAAEQRLGGASLEQIADYLVTIEIEWMGLSPAPGVRARAVQVAEALSDYVVSQRP